MHRLSQNRCIGRQARVCGEGTCIVDSNTFRWVQETQGSMKILWHLKFRDGAEK